MDARATGIKLLREWAQVQVHSGKDIPAIHASLLQATQAILGEFRTEFDVPGCRYWEAWRGEFRFRFITGAGEPVPESSVGTVTELSRDEYLAREGLHFGYGDRL